MKKVIVTFLILLTVIASILYFLKSGNAENNDAENNSKVNLETKIEEFSALDEEEQIKVKRIIKEKKFNDSYKILLFLQQNNSLGYVILQDDKIKSMFYVGEGEGEIPRYVQYKNYFIVYGKKPNKNTKELRFTINTGYNHIEKIITLDEGEYFLSIGKLPKDIKESNVWTENFRYN